MPRYEDEVQDFFGDEGRSVLDNLGVSEDQAHGVRKILEEMADIDSQIGRISGDPTARFQAGAYASAWADAAQKAGVVGIAETMRQIRSGYDRQQSLAEAHTQQQKNFFERVGTTGLAAVTEFADKASGGTSTTAAAAIADLLPGTLFDPSFTRERIAPGSAIVRGREGRGMVGDTEAGAGFLTGRLKGKFHDPAVAGAKGFHRGRATMLEAVAGGFGGDGLFGEGTNIVNVPEFATSMGRLAGFITPASGIGKLGTRLMQANSGGRLARTVGSLLGGSGRQGVGNFASRMWSSSMNFGATEALLGVSASANEAAQAAQRGEGYVTPWIERLSQVPTDMMAGYLTGSMMPIFSSFGEKFGRAIGGARGANIQKSFGEIWRRDAGSAMAAKGGQMIGGGVEFLPFGLLPNMHDPGNPFGVAQDLLDAFDDDPKKAWEARKRFLGHFLTGVVLKGSRGGKLISGPAQTRKDRFKQIQEIRASRLTTAKVRALQEKVLDGIATEQERQELLADVNKELGREVVQLTPVENELLRRMLEEVFSPDVMGEREAQAFDVWLMRMVIVADSINKARGDTRGPIWPRLRMAAEAQVKAPGSEKKIAELEGDIERMQDAMAAGRPGAEERLKASRDRLAEELGEDPVLVREYAEEAQQIQTSLNAAEEHALFINKALELPPAEQMQVFRELVESPDWRQLLLTQNPVFLGGAKPTHESVNRAFRAAEGGLDAIIRDMNNRFETVQEVGLRAERHAVEVGTKEARDRMRKAVKEQERAARTAGQKKEGAKADRAATVSKAVGEETTKEGAALALEAFAEQRVREGQPNRAKGYQAAADAVRKYDKLIEIAEKGGLDALALLPGIGKKTGRVIMDALIQMGLIPKPAPKPPRKRVTRAAKKKVVAAGAAVKKRILRAARGETVVTPKTKEQIEGQRGRIARRKERRERDDDRRLEEAIDPLTGLMFGRRAREAIDAHDGPVLYGDLGNLKLANTVGGDAAGDALIAEAGATVLRLARASADVAVVRFGRREKDQAAGALRLREGGDEFIILPKSMAGGRRFMREAGIVLENIQVGDKTIPVVFDWGLGSNLESAEGAMKRAKAKRKGKAGIGTREDLDAAASTREGTRVISPEPPLQVDAESKEGEVTAPEAVVEPTRIVKPSVAPTDAPKSPEKAGPETKIGDREGDVEDFGIEKVPTTKKDALARVQTELNRRPDGPGRAMPSTLRGASAEEINHFHDRLVKQRETAEAEREADASAATQQLADLEGQSSISLASQPAPKTKHQRDREAAAALKRKDRGSRRRKIKGPGKGFLSGTPEAQENYRIQTRDIERDIYTAVKEADKFDVGTNERAEQMLSAASMAESMLDQARRSLSQNKGNEDVAARVSMLERAARDTRQWARSSQSAFATSDAHRAEKSTSMAEDNTPMSYVDRVNAWAEAVEAQYEEWRATRPKRKNMKGWEKRYNKRLLERVKYARNLSKMAARVLAETGKQGRIVTSGSGVRELPLPVVGDWWIYRMANGSFVEGIITKISGRKGKIGRRLTLEREDGTEFALRINDAVDVAPSSIAEMTMLDLQEGEPRRQILSLQREARREHIDGERGIEVTTGGLLHLLDVSSPEHTTRVKASSGIGESEKSDQRKEQIKSGDHEGEYEIPDVEAMAARTKRRAEQAAEGVPLKDREGGASPPALTKTGDVIDAMIAEAKVREDRWRNNDQRPDDYLFEAMSLMVPPADRIIVVEGRAKTHAEVQSEIQGKYEDMRELDSEQADMFGQRRIDPETGKITVARRMAVPGKKGEPVEYVEDVGRYAEEFLIDHGTTHAIDPREITFNPFDAIQRDKWHQALKKKAEDGDLQSAMDQHRYERLMTLRAQAQAAEDIQSMAVKVIKRRRIGLLLEHPKDMETLSPGGEIMLRVRTDDDNGRVRRGRTFVGRLLKSGNWRIRELRSIADQGDWLTKNGIGEDPRNFHAQQREIHKSQIAHEHEIAANSGKYVIIKSRTEQVADLFVNAAYGDAKARKILGAERPEFLAATDEYVGRHPVPPDGGIARKAWRTLFEDWMGRRPEHQRFSQSLVEGVRVKASEGPAVKEDTQREELDPTVPEPEQKRSVTIGVGGEEGQAGAKGASLVRLTDAEIASSRDGGFMFHLAHEAIRHGLDPLTGNPIRLDSKGKWRIVNPTKRGQGEVLGSMLGGPWGFMRSETGRDIFREGKKVLQTPWHVLRGAAEGGTNAVRFFAWDPIRTILFNPERAGQMLPFARLQEGGDLYNSLADRGRKNQRMFGDPESGDAVRREMNDHDARLKANPVRVVEALRDFVNELTNEQQLDAFLKYDARQETHPLLKPYHELAMEVGQRAVAAGLLTEAQFKKHAGAWIPYGRWIWDNLKAVESIKAEQKLVNQARASIRQMVAQAEADRPKAWKGQMDTWNRQVTLGTEKINGMQKNMRNGHWFSGDRVQVGGHPLDAVTGTESFAPHARTRTFDNMSDAIARGLDVREPWRLALEGLTAELEAVERVEFFNRVAERGELILEAELAPRDWYEVTADDVSRDVIWKKLQGKAVEPYLMDQLLANEPSQSSVTRIYEQMHSAVKLGLTMYNPSNWATQIIGNPLIMISHGMGIMKVMPAYSQGLAAAFGHGTYGEKIDFYRRKNWVDQPTDADREFVKWLERDNGVDMFKEGGFSALMESLTAALRGDWQSSSTRGRRSAKDLTRFISTAFRRLDSAARIALYEHKISKGLSDRQATDEVNRSFDLAHVNSFARQARKGTAKIFGKELPMPVMADSFVSIKAALSRDFWKMAQGSLYSYMNFMVFAKIWNGIIGNYLDMDDDEVAERIEASTPNYNAVTHWMDSNSSLLMGEGVMNWSRWMPWEPAADLIPGVKQALTGGHDQFGQTAGQAVISSLLGGRNTLAGPGIEYMMDRDRQGRSVRDRLQEPGLLGTTGIMRQYMDNGVIPSLLSGGASRILGAPMSATPGVIAGTTNLWRKIENADKYYQVINQNADPSQVKVRKRTGHEVFSDIMGARISLPNFLRRQQEALRFTTGTRQTQMGRRLTFGLDPSSPEGLKARTSLRDEAALKQVEQGYRLYGEVVDWQRFPEERERIEARWKRWMGTQERLKSAIRGLGLVGAVGKQREVLDVLRSSGLLMEAFPPSTPIGRTNVKRIIQQTAGN